MCVLTWPFMGRDPHLPIFGGWPFLQASNRARVDSGVRHLGNERAKNRLRLRREVKVG